MTNRHDGNRMDGQMSLAEFAALLDRHGAEPRRWPVDRRAAAEALRATSPEARALLGDAAALDRLLDSAELPLPSSDLRTAILAAAPRRQATSRRPAGVWAELWAALGGWRPATAAFAASLMLGIASGGVLFPESGEDLGTDFAQLAFFDDDFAGY